MSAFGPKPIVLFALLSGSGAACTTTPVSMQAQSKPSTTARKAANPNKSATGKRAPARKPATPPQPTGTFQVPQLEEDNWYNLDSQKSSAPVVENTSRNQQVGAIAALSYFGSGVGIEYIHNWQPYSLSVSGLYTAATLKDEIDTGENETVQEFFDAKSLYLRAHGRYTFFRYAYAGGGVTLDRVNGSYGWRGGALTAGELKTDFTAQVITADLFVGSEFRGPYGLYFGVDWLGTSIPITRTISYDDSSDLELTTLAFKGAKPDQRIDDETTAQLRIYYLNLRVGYTF